MTRAGRVRHLGMLVVAALGCVRSTSTVAVGERPAPVPCDRSADTLFVAVTPEVDPATVRSFLAQAPLGACATVGERRIPEREARDAMDAGVAMLITSVPSVLAYAETRADLASTPLGWDREYAVVVAGPVASLPVGDDLDSLRVELARDVVRADARASTAMPCGAAPTLGPHAPRVAYAREDLIARSIASRLVALARPADSLRVVARDGASAGRGDALTVIALRVDDSLPCEAGYVVPLVETRARAITPVERP